MCHFSVNIILNGLILVICIIKIYLSTPKYNFKLRYALKRCLFSILFNQFSFTIFEFFCIAYYDNLWCCYYPCFWVCITWSIYILKGWIHHYIHTYLEVFFWSLILWCVGISILSIFLNINILWMCSRQKMCWNV